MAQEGTGHCQFLIGIERVRSRNPLEDYGYLAYQDRNHYLKAGIYVFPSHRKRNRLCKKQQLVI